MPPPKLELELNNFWNAVLVMTCPRCHHRIRRYLLDLPPSAVIECDCGYAATLTGGYLQSLQKSVDDLERSLRSLGR